MRAHCINLYDDEDQHEGDMWLSALNTGRLQIDVDYGDARCGVELRPDQVRDLRSACDAYLGGAA